MKMGRNSLSKAIDAAGPEARHDECVKRILSHLPILARILKGCADEFKDVPVERIEKECIEKEPQISTVALDQDAGNKRANPFDNQHRGAEHVEGYASSA